MLPNIANQVSSPISWPSGSRFALFLSHDIDQIHDREMFRILADTNHIRRMLLQNEKGDVGLALKRIARCLFWPNRTGDDVQVLLDIEKRFQMKSTFYILHDPYLSRNGPRYRIDSKGLRRIVDLIKAAGCEIGVHGGYYRFNNANGYQQSRELISRKFNCRATGIRNHMLRFSYPETWLAQEAAGFTYDATFGDRQNPGAVNELFFPFRPHDPATQRVMDLTVLPLTVMDVSLFRYRRLDSQPALEVAWKAVLPIIERGGLVSLLWHNNYFNEPEYYGWQWVYEKLLERCAQYMPWTATGAEIDLWCRQQWKVSQ